MLGERADDLERAGSALPLPGTGELEDRHDAGSVRARQVQSSAEASSQSLRSSLRRLATAGWYAEAVVVIEQDWDGSPLRGADGLLALVAAAREGRFELVDRLAAHVEWAKGPALRNEAAYGLGLLSVSPHVQPAMAKLFGDAGRRIATQALIDVQGAVEPGGDVRGQRRAAVLDTLALCLVGSGQPQDALAQLELIDDADLSRSERGAVACTRAMALAKVGDRRAARDARSEAVALGAPRPLLDAAAGVIVRGRLPSIELGDTGGWAKLALLCVPFAFLTALFGHAASAGQIGVAIAAVVAVPVLSLALHELAHPLVAHAQGLKVLAVRFNGTRAETSVAMFLGLPPSPVWVLAAPPVTAALAALGAVGLTAPPSLGLTRSLVQLTALWLLLVNAGVLVGILLPAQGKREREGDLVSAWKHHRARQAWLLGLEVPMARVPGTTPGPARPPSAEP